VQSGEIPWPRRCSSSPPDGTSAVCTRSSACHRAQRSLARYISLMHRDAFEHVLRPCPRTTRRCPIQLMPARRVPPSLHRALSLALPSTTPFSRRVPVHRLPTPTTAIDPRTIFSPLHDTTMFCLHRRLSVAFATPDRNQPGSVMRRATSADAYEPRDNHRSAANARPRGFYFFFILVLVASRPRGPGEDDLLVLNCRVQFPAMSTGPFAERRPRPAGARRLVAW